MQSVSLIADQFAPSTGLSGSASGLFRGRNVMVRGLGGIPRLESYPGSLYLNEEIVITGDTLTGSANVAITSGSNALVNGSGTSAFQKEIKPGMTIMVDDEPVCIDSVTDDNHAILTRAAQHTGTGGARFMPVIFEIDRKRGVLRRGNAIVTARKDILFIGSGTFYINGVSTGFTASQRVQRMERATDGTYSLKKVGFDAAPPVPTIDTVPAGYKGELDGNYSFLISYWNSVTDGFSNPSPVQKLDSTGAAITIQLASGKVRFRFDFTTPLASMPSNADGFIIWKSLSGGGVQAVNQQAYATGPWYRMKKIRTSASAFATTDVSAANNTITIPNHGYSTGDSVFVDFSLGGLTAGTNYFVIFVDVNTIKLADTGARSIAGTPVIDLTGVEHGNIKMLDASNRTYVEALDAELGLVATGNNDPPADGEWLVDFSNTPFIISALGKLVSTNKLGSSPGNYVIPSKTNNKEAFPLTWRVSVGDEITGFAAGIGRLFLQTANGIPFVTPTGRTEIAQIVPTLLDMPYTSRPFWSKGGVHPYGLTVIQGELFNYSGRKPLRSPSNADENSVVPYEMGLKVEDLTNNYYDGFTFPINDPKNQHLCIISSAVGKNGSGYWYSEILPFDLKTGQWLPTIRLSKTDRDMIVTSAAVVSGRLEFLAGGKVSGGTYTMRAYRYDEYDALPCDYSFIFAPTDSGLKNRAKKIRSVQVTALANSPVVQIHGARWDGDLVITDMEEGTNPLATIVLPSSSTLKHAIKTNYLVKDLIQWALRFSGTNPGSSTPDRIDEIVVEVGMSGVGQ